MNERFRASVNFLKIGDGYILLHRSDEYRELIVSYCRRMRFSCIFSLQAMYPGGLEAAGSGSLGHIQVKHLSVSTTPQSLTRPQIPCSFGEKGISQFKHCILDTSEKVLHLTMYIPFFTLLLPEKSVSNLILVCFIGSWNHASKALCIGLQQVTRWSWFVHAIRGQLLMIHTPPPSWLPKV